jgi:hypothetical protein
MLKSTRLKPVLMVAVVVPLSTTAAQSDATITARTRDTVVGAVIDQLEGRYIFPAVVTAMNRDLRSRLTSGEYASVTNANAFASLLTSQLRAISHDKHIVVEWTSNSLAEPGGSQLTTEAQARERERKESAFINFGFRNADRLPGNIGYLALTYFDRPQLGQNAAAAAMALLHNTDALIIDVTDNDGGRPEMVALLMSYLVEMPTELSGIYWRKTGRIDKSFTVVVPDSLKYVGKNVYVLTSSAGTISAAEAFAYDLHLLKRATLVGEVTAGAANPGGYVRLTDHFRMFVPTGRAVSPISGTNWEGVGIKPDIEVAAGIARKTAHLGALNALLKTATDPERIRYLQSVIEQVQAEK